MMWNSNELIDLHKYLVSSKLIESFIENDSYNTGSHVGYLHEGNWFKNLPNEFAISREMFLIFCVHLYYLWEIESKNKLYYVFEQIYSDDKEFIKNYLNETEVCNELFILASERLQSDYELLLQYTAFGYPEGGYACIVNLHENVLNNRELMLRLVTDNPDVFCELNEKFCDDEEFAAIAIKHDGVFLEFAGEKNRDNEKLVALAIKNNIKAVLFASKRLRKFHDGMFYEQYWHVKNDIEFK